MKFVMKAIVYVVVMNTVLLFGAALFDSDYEFHFIFNLVVPVLCAYASWGVERKREKSRRKV